jgi:hypothetical protein
MAQATQLEARDITPGFDSEIFVPRLDREQRPTYDRAE